MNEEIYSLLAKYFSGQATAEEEAAVKKWASSTTSNQAEFDAAKKIWEQTDDDTGPEFDTDAAWEKVSAVIRQKPAAARGILRSTGFRIAAAAAVLLFIAAFWWLSGSGNEKISVTATVPVQDVLLEDGSHVYLRKNATLQYRKHFAGNKREVALSGEAFFEVAKNPEKKFIITTRNATVEVLGTSFLVNATEDEAAILVKTGLVRFSSRQDSSQSVQLHAGENAVIGKNGLSRSVNTDENIGSWQTGVLTFRNTPLRDAVQALARHYQLSFTIRKGEEDKVGATTITTTFSNQPLDNVIRELEMITGFHIRKLNNTACEISSQ